MPTIRIAALLICLGLFGTACFMPKLVIAGGINTVIIDAGHGGKDPGAVGSLVKEKEIALGVALKLGHYIETKLEGVKVVYTRKTDIFPTLQQRATIANENNGDLFISIHVNSGPAAAHGTETLVMGTNEGRNMAAIRENSVVLLEENYKDNYDGFDPNAPETEIIFSLYQSQHISQSVYFAAKVEDQFKNRAGRKSRGVKRQGLLVLYKTAMPGVLIETGFLSNLAEQKYLMSTKGQDYIASAIFRAFRDYKAEVEGVDVSSFVKEVKARVVEVKVVKKEPLVVEDIIEKPIEEKAVEVIADKQEKVSQNTEELAEVKSEITALADTIIREKGIETESIQKNKTEKSPAQGSIEDSVEKENKGIADVESLKLENKDEIQVKKEVLDLVKSADQKSGNVVHKSLGSETVSVDDVIDVPLVIDEDIKETKREEVDMELKAKPELRFRVQVRSSTNLVELIPDNFNGLTKIGIYVDKGVNKFVYGSEDNIKAAVNLQNHAREVGFKGAFVVAFLGQERIDLSEAIELSKKAGN
ncbi:MAG: N-acetylmuramoyl-L-alanine amidase [Flavobacteriales bacterium]|nr:N-acetylmuramoyl-L-alanine amidase [Flavobacteriales bacterium]